MLNISRIEEIMLKKKIKKSDVLRKCNMTRPTLDKILRGGDINLSTLESLSKGLDVPMSVLLVDNITVAIEDKSVGLNGDENNIVTTGDEKERIAFLEKLLDEKERLIKEKERLISVLMAADK
jgi:transcriptional regulator with XRE-family HTH domain